MNEIVLSKIEAVPELERDVERARLKVVESAKGLREELKPLRVVAEFVRKHPYGCALGAFAAGALLGAIWPRHREDP